MHPSTGRSGHLLPQGEKVCRHQLVWNRRSLLATSVLVLSASLPVLAQSPTPIEELGRHLEGMKRQLEDTSIGVAQREILAIESAGTLDRAAQAETRIAAKQAHWNEAVRLLDEFRAKNPDQTRKHEFQLQAAVYRWAQARAWHDRHQLFPADAESLERETKALDDAITRLRDIVSDDQGVLADNIRFRLAWALADRAALEERNAPTRTSREEEALKLLEIEPSEPRLSGYHGLLKADLLRRAGKITEAAAVATAAARTSPPPPDAEILDVTVRLLVDDKKFNEAKSVVASSKLPPGAKALALARIALAEARAPGDEGPAAVTRDLLPQIQILRDLKALELRIALSEWAASGVEPGDADGPEAWDALAEGTEIRGDTVKAAGFEEKAAARAEQTGAKEAAAGFRLRGAGFLFQAGKYAEADALLTRVIDDPQAGASRPKAGLLQCLARGRALAAGSRGVTTRDYAEALERQIREFPDDPTAIEAKWLLGGVERARGDLDKARVLWTAIPASSPRWIDARLAIADAMRQDIESRLGTADDDALAKEFAAAQAFLTETQATAQTRDESDQVELLIREARLNLLPKLGKPRQARDALDHCNGKNLTASQRYRARLLQTISLAALGRYVEAEREAQQHPTWADRESSPAFLDATRLLDLCESNSDTDLQQRRFGLVVRLLVEPVLKNDDDAFKPEEKAELTLRLARAVLFQGDTRRAQDTLRGWNLPRGAVPDHLLRDLADLYARLEAYDLAVDVERLRIRNLNSGSTAWFDARYNLALAYYRLGRRREALELIERTAILHPELGGVRLQEKFVRLRQRLSAAP